MNPEKISKPDSAEISHQGEYARKKISPDSTLHDSFLESVQTESEGFFGDRLLDYLERVKKGDHLLGPVTPAEHADRIEAYSDRYQRQLKIGDGIDQQSPLFMNHHRTLTKFFYDTLKLDKTRDIILSDPEVQRQLLAHDKVKTEAERMVGEARFDMLFENELSAFSKDGPTHMDLSSFFALAFMRDRNFRLPNHVMELLIRNHAETYELAKRKLERELPKKLQILREQLAVAAEKGVLPVSKDRIKTRLDRVKIVAKDPLMANLERVGGTFDGSREIIYINPSQFDIQHTLTHEAIHCLSGRTLEADFYASSDGINTKPAYGLSDRLGNNRIGLRFDTEYESKLGDPERKVQFHWLNEAVTEEMTKKVLGDQYAEQGTYELERALYHALRTRPAHSDDQSPSEMPEKLFTDAFFEDYDPNEQNKIPKWKELQRAINERHGYGNSNYLVSLDNTVRESSALEAYISFKDYEI